MEAYISPTSPYISPTSPLHLPYISPTSPLHLPYISPIFPQEKEDAVEHAPPAQTDWGLVAVLALGAPAQLTLPLTL